MTDQLIELYYDFLLEEVVLDLEPEVEIAFSMLREITRWKDFSAVWDRMSSEDKSDLLNNLVSAAVDRV